MSDGVSLLEMSMLFDGDGHSPGRLLLAFDRRFLCSYGQAEQESFIEAFREFFVRTSREAPKEGAGRRPIGRFLFSNGECAVFRTYARGGLFQRVVRQTFVRAPAGRRPNGFRPYDEFRVLRKLFSLGIAVPEPLGVLVRTRVQGLFYRGALSTLEIRDSKNALDILRDSGADGRLSYICRDAGAEARKALLAGVLHRDLHLGNILAAGGKTYLIDFDRAKEFRHSVDCAEYREQLLSRFKRSALKHRCPQLVEPFREGLFGERR